MERTTPRSVITMWHVVSQARVCACLHSYLERIYRRLGLSSFGSIVVWVYCRLGLSSFGFIVLWVYYRLALLSYGFIVIWFVCGTRFISLCYDHQPRLSAPFMVVVVRPVGSRRVVTSIHFTMNITMRWDRCRRECPNVSQLTIARPDKRPRRGPHAGDSIGREL
jgi:hypothetical protein